MVINLQKGQRISLAKETPGLSKVVCGLGWDVANSKVNETSNTSGKTQDFDLDASVVCLDRNGKLSHHINIIYFGNLSHHSGAIVHLGDNLTGEGDGDDEKILVDLSQIPSEIEKLFFLVNIYECNSRQQEFGQVNNAFVRLINISKNREIAKYSLSGSEYRGMTGMIIAEIYREKNEWNMAAIGKGIHVNSLSEIVKMYS